MSTGLKTVIVSAFPGCGKTYMVQNRDKHPIQLYGTKRICICRDSDSSKYPRTSDRYQRYVDDIEDRIGDYDIIFISQQDELRQELQKRNIPFIVVGPNQSPWLNEKERMLIKQQWFGRFLLRDNSHIYDIDSWMTSLKENWDEWTSPDHYAEYGAKDVITLKADQYLSDIWGDIYWRSQTLEGYSAFK
ncbi:MAG: hypothetical protein IJ526_03230 [Lachnospiraceae bacterium]|nr:hypothetical protein [Lachnospiraceae bacterium]